jgi:hypothetical protein
MGGISALFPTNHGNHNQHLHESSHGGNRSASGSNSVRSKNSAGNMSNRYGPDLLDDNDDDDFSSLGGGGGDFHDDRFFDSSDPLLMNAGSEGSLPQQYLQWWEFPVTPRAVSPP